MCVCVCVCVFIYFNNTTFTINFKMQIHKISKNEYTKNCKNKTKQNKNTQSLESTLRQGYKCKWYMLGMPERGK